MDDEYDGVLTSAGKAQQVRWLGFIDRSDAKLTNGRPVKLVISELAGLIWSQGQYVQGCLVGNGCICGAG